MRKGHGWGWSGKDLGTVTGVFFGPNYEGMGGVLERHDLSLRPRRTVRFSGAMVKESRSRTYSGGKAASTSKFTHTIVAAFVAVVKFYVVLESIR